VEVDDDESSFFYFISLSLFFDLDRGLDLFFFNKKKTHL